MTEKDKEVRDLRDSFAAKGLEGALASSLINDLELKNPAALAEWCYTLADAMVEARKEQTNKEYHLYVSVTDGVVDTIYGDAVPDSVKLVFHVRDRADIAAGEQIDPLPFDYQPELIYYD